MAQKPFMSDMVPPRKPVRSQPVIRRDPEPVAVEDEELYREPIVHRSATAKLHKKISFAPIVALGCLVALGITIGNLFLNASLVVIPKHAQGSLDALITFSNTDSGGTPFATATKIFKKEEIVPATGKIVVAAAANGTVRFYNSLPTKKTVPKGTSILSADKVIYTTDKAVSLPAGSTKKPASSDVTVHATEAGSQGNRGLDDFTFATPTKALQGITIRSVTPLVGGARGDDAVADQGSIDSAKEQLLTAWPDQRVLMERVGSMIPRSMIMLPVALSTGSVETHTEADHGDGVHVVATQTVQVILVDRVELGRKIADALGASKDIRFEPVSLEGLSFSGVSLTEGGSTLQVHISGPVDLQGSIDPVLIRGKVPGMSKSQVKALLATFPEIDHATVAVMPPWRRLLPLDPGRIGIKVQ